MGLDLYLTKRKCTSDNTLKVKVGEKTKRTYEETEVMYLRKANQIHRWFVENHADGIDECQKIYVSIDDLKELKDTCEKVIKASKLIPAVIKGGWASRTVDHNKRVAKLTTVVINGKAVFLITGTAKVSDLELGDMFLLDWSEQDQKIGDTCEEADLLKARENDNDQQVRLETVGYYVGKLIKNAEVAEKYLPTVAGFFFGDTQYTEHYLEELKDCVKQLDETIADYEAEIKAGVDPYDLEYIYQASW